MIIALYQPDIPQNTGQLARFCTCLGLELHIIEPAGFSLSDKDFKRGGLDYADAQSLRRHDNWEKFQAFCREQGLRIVLLTTKAEQNYLDFQFFKNDALLFGRESAGVPDVVYEAANARLIIPMQESARSLNIVTACSMVCGEVLRQTRKITD
jgi:tRNA (cytidine/uridine-2'-O-)-methyltransferase